MVYVLTVNACECVVRNSVVARKLWESLRLGMNKILESGIFKSQIASIATSNHTLRVSLDADNLPACATIDTESI